METARRLSLLAATLTCGLTAGLLFGYACSVMPALSGSGDGVFVEVMQRINVAILNGWFLVCFVGALVLGVLAVALQLAGQRGPALVGAGLGLALYLASLAVTAVVNVPLNDALAAVPFGEASGEPSVLAAARVAFEQRWVVANLARTVLATASFACFAWSLAAGGPGQG
jgi:uncharacterized membrane protein